MSKLTREQRLNQSQAQLEEQVLGYQLSQEELQAQADLLATKQAVSASKAKLESLKSSQTLSLVDIVSAENEVEALTKGQKRLEALIKELFPTK
jgi:hypothetical protein